MIRRIAMHAASAFLIAFLFVSCVGPAPIEKPAGTTSAPPETATAQTAAKPATPPDAAAPSATPAPTTPPAAPAPPTPAAPEAAPRSAKVYRDTWGVPHIYADTEADAAYAVGYCQAEDRLEDIFLNVRTALGCLAEVTGPDEDVIKMDYFMQLARNGELCELFWKSAPPQLRAIGDAYVRGVQAYMAEHPEKKPEAALDLQGWHCAAVGRAMILRWPIGAIMDDYNHRKKDPGIGSNEWAVAPARSADGCAILLTDPHLTWTGLAKFYEARVDGGALHMNGFMLVGSPIIALGHNEHVGWACTTGGPDTSDCYEMKVNFSNMLKPQYEYDGQMVDIEMKQIIIKVKGKDPVVRPAGYTKLGPLISEPDKNGVAYVGASPYFDQAGALFEQMYAMCLAKNASEFYAALGMNQMMEQNLMFADTDGNIEYIRGGRVPIRPDGYDWDAPVPGNISATKWLGIHDIKELVQCKNPPQGYFANCNVSPENMMKNSPMTPDKYKKYLYNVSWDSNNARGRRIVHLLDADASVTKEEAIAYAMDVYDELVPAWQKALKKAVDAFGAARMQDPEFAKAVNDILAWNCEYTTDSVAAPVVMYWRLKAQQDNGVDVAAIANEKSLNEGEQVKLLTLLSDTLALMKAGYGKLGVTWGDIYKVGRGGKLFGTDGAEFGGGKDKMNQTDTLRDTEGEEETKGSGVFVAKQGSMATILMFMRKDGIESFSATPWGQSADPASPHYMDQGEKLYAKRVMKPTWWKKDDLLKNKESEKDLAVK
ncbi:MAG: penicillin acylase family protein [Candidatus Hydrogenedentes bacterium]|nr:penicillin acylase family protein [Candidatus Hydrogenedentota bacterium]